MKLIISKLTPLFAAIIVYLLPMIGSAQTPPPMPSPRASAYSDYQREMDAWRRRRERDFGSQIPGPASITPIFTGLTCQGECGQKDYNIRQALAYAKEEAYFALVTATFNCDLQFHDMPDLKDACIRQAQLQYDEQLRKIERDTQTQNRDYINCMSNCYSGRR